MNQKDNPNQNVSIKTFQDEEGSVIAAKQYIGPIPTAEEFADYKSVDEQIPREIMDVFKADSESARKMKKDGLAATIQSDKRSQYMAFTIIMVGLIGTIFLAYFDKEITSLCTGVATAAFIFDGTFQRKK